MTHFLNRTVIALFMLAGLSGYGNAQSAAGDPPSVHTPRLDADALKIPDSRRGGDADKIVGKTPKPLPPPSIPSKVDLGKYDLEFKAQRSSDVNPRTGFDSGEKSNLSNSSLGRQQESAVPNYFGLKLSTPTE
jgi:hypothetical protein